MHVIEIIEKKRDRNQLSKQEINFIVNGVVDGSMPDYQTAAFLMATCINGMNSEEISWLTDAMLYSGEVIVHQGASTPFIDKHSTGGVGDKISIPLAPAMAACGLKVPMIAGRGLGHTGGTLDKLEAIPGFRCGLSIREYQEQVERIGCVIMGQTKDIAPADKKLYALRDVTGTVPSIPLVSSSIMSKKLAEGINGLVLDVKFGQGAFMKELCDARALATTMVAIGSHLNKQVTAKLTNMDQPLGRMVGNGLEIIESIDILCGQGPQDSKELTIDLGAEMLLLAKKAKNFDDARRLVIDALSSGQAFSKFLEMVETQGGDVRVVHEPKLLLSASQKLVVPSPATGFISGFDCHAIGFVAGILGGGRSKLSDKIDHGVGIEMHVKIGDGIECGQPLCTIFANRQGVDEAKQRLQQAITISNEPCNRPQLIADRITNNN